MNHCRSEINRSDTDCIAPGERVPPKRPWQTLQRRIRCRDRRESAMRSHLGSLSLTVTKESGLRVLVNSKMASLVGNRMPGIAVAVQPFETTTEASAVSTRLTFAPKRRETGVRQRKKSVKDVFSARIRRFFHKDALKAPGEFDTILHALERPKVAAAVRNQDPLAMARPRGIEAKRRMLADEGGVLSAEGSGDS